MPSRLPSTKMTKTQVIRYMADQMTVSPKQGGRLLRPADRDCNHPDEEAGQVHNPRSRIGHKRFAINTLLPIRCVLSRS